MISPEKMYAGITTFCLAAGVMGGYIESQHGGASFDHEKWNAQKGRLALELQEGLPQVLTRTSLRDQLEYQQKIEQIKAIDTKLQSDTRNANLESLGAGGIVLGMFIGPVTGAHWYAMRRDRIGERKRKIRDIVNYYHTSR